MRDLHLWQLLHHESPDLGELVPLLEELGRCPVTVRFPYMAAAAQLVEHPLPSVRAAAIPILAGGGGNSAYQHLVKALYDEDKEVKKTALAGLLKSVVHDPDRWFHALFHPDLEIRRGAVDHPPLHGREWWNFHLLSDENLQVERDVLLPSTAPPPRWILPTVLEFYNQKKITPLETKRILLPIISTGLPSQQLISRPVTEQEKILQKPQIRHPNLSPDQMDDLINLYSRIFSIEDEEKKFEERWNEKFFYQLERIQLSSQKENNPSLATRVAASILNVFPREKEWRISAAKVLALANPEFAFWPWVPKHIRRQSLAALYDYRDNLEKWTDERVEEKLTTDLVRNGDGVLDLWVVGALYCLVKKEISQKILKQFPLEDLARAFLQQPEESTSFLRLLDLESRRGKKYLQEIAQVGDFTKGRIYGYLIHGVRADQLDFLDPLSTTRMNEVMTELLVLEYEEDLFLVGNKLIRFGQILEGKVKSNYLVPFLQSWIRHPEPHKCNYGLEVFTVFSRRLPTDELVEKCLQLSDEELTALTTIIEWCSGFPYGKEVALAEKIKGHDHPDLAKWAGERVVTKSVPPPTPKKVKAPPGGKKITSKQLQEIAGCSESDLSKALAPCLKVPGRGLTSALADRDNPRHTNLDVCVALLATRDPWEEVAVQFDRFAIPAKNLEKKIDREMCRRWNYNPSLGTLGDIWLSRWEFHLKKLEKMMELIEEGCLTLLEIPEGLNLKTNSLITKRIWKAVEKLLSHWRFRNRDALQEYFTGNLGDYMVNQLTGGWRLIAASCLLHVHKSGVLPDLVENLREQVEERLPDYADEVRKKLEGWVKSEGLSISQKRPTLVDHSLSPETLAEIRSTKDLDFLEEQCRSSHHQAVEEASLRLVELGETGRSRLSQLILHTPPLHGQPVMVQTVPLYEPGPSLDALEEYLKGDHADELAYHLAIAFLEMGEDRYVPVIFESLQRPVKTSWFGRNDWKGLVQLGLSREDLALELATSPQPYAYQAAVIHLWEDNDIDETKKAQGLRQFLLTDSQRLGDLRLRAGWWLADRGDLTALPLLLRNLFEEVEFIDEVGTSAWLRRAEKFTTQLSTDQLKDMVTSALLAGNPVVKEVDLVHLFRQSHFKFTTPIADPGIVQSLLGKILREALDERVRSSIIELMKKHFQRGPKFRKLAETFAWGVETGRKLTDQIFSVEMTEKEGLGYTRLHQNRIFISPLPILKSEKNGEVITKGLIIHEYGHHLYHKKPEDLEVWDQAEKEKLHGLLNLVSDEHLERNLRSMDRDYDRYLKNLAAYAFLHSERDIRPEQLIITLGYRAFEVITSSPIRVSRRRGHVKVEGGKLLGEMERCGMSFARFIRALRMGLGNRYDDPKVSQGLELFDKKFRNAKMTDMWEISLELRRIFGRETDIVESLGQDTMCSSNSGDIMVFGEGMSQEELKAEVERILKGKGKNRKRDNSKEGTPMAMLNVSPDERFDPITNIVSVPYDSEKHRTYVRRVTRSARKMRSYLEELGLSWSKVRGRLSGRALDQTKLRRLVLHGDPRILIQRKLEVNTDLFLGVAIDCSGSMSIDENLEKAKLFGTLLAQAAQGLAGIDVRIFGFCDQALYDAGSSSHCSVHNLKLQGGNNDAAALWHLAQLARRSHRRARLLIMISDGLPTECSIAALKALVQKLTSRWNMCCAQVAVRPLVESCFDHYIELGARDLTDSVAEFGRIVARLVWKAVKGR